MGAYSPSITLLVMINIMICLSPCVPLFLSHCLESFDQSNIHNNLKIWFQMT